MNILFNELQHLQAALNTVSASDKLDLVTKLTDYVSEALSEVCTSSERPIVVTLTSLTSNSAVLCRAL